jgi:F-type H+-transporting ATPase subunit delta
MATPRVAHRYAKSLISLARDHSSVDEIQSDLQLIQQALRESKDLGLMLKSPVVLNDKKLRVLDGIFAGKISEISLSFIRILVEKGREALLHGIAESGLALIRELKNIQRAEVTTAVPMDDATRERVQAEARKLHDGGIELLERVDESIIGGFILKMNDRMVDASTRQQLQTLRRELTEHDYEPEF